MKNTIKISKTNWLQIGRKAGWIDDASIKKTAQHLDNVKQMDLNERELMRAIRDAIIAEQDAIKQYEAVSDSTSNKKAKDVLQDIANEEKVHVGELQALLNSFSSEEKDFLEEGEKEIGKI